MERCGAADLGEMLSELALTEEERRSVEEEKQLFFNQIGLDEDSLKDMFNEDFDLFLSGVNASTDEELQSVWDERVRFLKGVNFKKALDKYIKKKQKSTAPAVYFA